jgi:hypothetical protein
MDTKFPWDREEFLKDPDAAKKVFDAIWPPHETVQCMTCGIELERCQAVETEPMEPGTGARELIFCSDQCDKEFRQCNLLGVKPKNKTS